jgi:hypothetical protein
LAICTGVVIGESVITKGDDVGTADGSDVGRKLGDDVGTADGSDVGRKLGDDVGTADGSDLGILYNCGDLVGELMQRSGFVD